MNECEIFLQKALTLVRLHLSCLQFVMISSITNSNNFPPLLKGLQKGEYKLNIELNWKQQFVDVLQNHCSQKFCKIHWKTSMLESFFNKVAVFKTWNFIKKTIQQRYFPVNFPKFLITPFLQNISGWLFFLIHVSNQGFIQWSHFFVC